MRAVFHFLPSLSKHMPNNFSKVNCAALVLAIFLLRPVPIKRWPSTITANLNSRGSIVDEDDASSVKSSNWASRLSWLRR
jgi:hypothetical protein